MRWVKRSVVMYIVKIEAQMVLQIQEKQEIDKRVITRNHKLDMLIV